MSLQIEIVQYKLIHICVPIMLFTRLFNWLKYKTLPPSVLFLNRLFVERDSKHRRVTSNLGLTFRNSKWSTYARTNINLSNRTSYFGLLLKLMLLLVTVIALVNFTNLYNLTALFSPVYTVLWFVSDSDLYLKIVFSSSILCSIQLVLSQLATSIFSLEPNSVSPNTLSTLDSSAQIPRRLHKPILHAWLTSDLSQKSFEKLFDSSERSNSTMAVYSSLFKSSFLLSKSTESGLDLFKFLQTSGRDSSNPMLKQSITTTTALNCPRLNSIGLDFTLFHNPRSVSTGYFDELSEWTLSSIQTEVSEGLTAPNSISGNFYTPSISHTNISVISLSIPELTGFKSSITNQLSMIQWQRWLYKYNLLHRSVLKASSSMTLTKRLINSGFYNSSIATRNIWSASALQSSQLDLNNAGSLYTSLYGDFNSVYSSLNDTLVSTSAFKHSSLNNSLRFYELSYHWFIQRFYLFNTLITNTLSSKPVLNASVPLKIQDLINQYSNSSLTLQLSRDSVAQTAYSTLDQSFSPTLYTPLTPTNVPSQTTSHLAYSEYLLFTKSRSEACQNMLRNSSLKSNQFFEPAQLPS